jgi:hypothetical protein
VFKLGVRGALGTWPNALSSGEPDGCSINDAGQRLQCLPIPAPRGRDRLIIVESAMATCVAVGGRPGIPRAVRCSGYRAHVGRQTQTRSSADAPVARQNRWPMASCCFTGCGHTPHVGSPRDGGVVCGNRSGRTTVDPVAAGMARSPVRGWVTGGKRLHAPLIDDVGRRARGCANRGPLGGHRPSAADQDGDCTGSSVSCRGHAPSLPPLPAVAHGLGR